MINYLVEFLGTFLFFYIILESNQYGHLQPFIIAIGLLVAILLFGKISGGHFNPAVSLMLIDKNDSSKLIGYILAQIAGGVMAYKVHGLINEKN